MNHTVLLEAEKEVKDAILYYEEKQEGLGVRFRDEADEYIRWILENPEVPRLRRLGYRRVNFDVFPYYIPYIIHENHIWILAFAHASKIPHYWIKRKP